MPRLLTSGTACALLLASLSAQSAEPTGGRTSLVLRGQSSRLVVDLAGGSLGDFRLAGSELNPLSWNAPKPDDSSIHGFGHFLCLDRWGPPSAAEGARGMPYHGEAANVRWTVLREVATQDAVLEAQMMASLPRAGLVVRRTLRMPAGAAVALVSEEVTNTNSLGRIFNIVQHPTIAAPFLDENTMVDCNGRRGFAQGEARPNPEEPSSFWPEALTTNGTRVDLRRLTSDPNPNVVSFAIEEPHGWITASAPKQELLLGYIWKTSDYPWVSLWRDVRDGRPAARGLEFGSTGLHQPFPVLVRQGRIWDRPLFEYLDAGESVTKSYGLFLMPIPPDFAGVESLRIAGGKLILRERRTVAPREFSVDTHGLIPE